MFSLIEATKWQKLLHHNTTNNSCLMCRKLYWDRYTSHCNAYMSFFLCLTPHVWYTTKYVIIIYKWVIGEWGYSWKGSLIEWGHWWMGALVEWAISEWVIGEVGGHWLNESLVIKWGIGWMGSLENESLVVFGQYVFRYFAPFVVNMLVSAHIVCEKLSAMQEQTRLWKFLAHFCQNTLFCPGQTPPSRKGNVGQDLGNFEFHVGKIPASPEHGGNRCVENAF